MSFIILILIIFLLYAVLSRYSNRYKVLLMIVLVLGLTTSFFIYGLSMLSKNEIFVILSTEVNMMVFIHLCLIWSAADMIVIHKIIGNYKKYVKVNS